MFFIVIILLYMIKLIFLTFLFSILIIFNNSYPQATYDFVLKAKGEYATGLDRKLIIDNIKVENGVIDYYIEYIHPTGYINTRYAGKSFFSLKGEFLPKEKILVGEMQDVVNHGVEGPINRETRCEFSSTIIEKDTKEVTLHFKNCLEDGTPTGYGPLPFSLIRISENIQDQKESEIDSNDSGVRFSDIYGEVEVLLPTGYDENGEPLYDNPDAWNFAKLDMQLPYGAKLKLKENSGIILAFPGSEPYEMRTPDNMYPYDETIIVLPSKQKGDSLFQILIGKLYNNVKKVINEGSMDVEMSQAVLGIKGTKFVLEENGTISNVSVLEGQVEFISKFSEQKQIINPGELVEATKDGLGQTIYFDLVKEQSLWNKNNNKIDINLIFYTLGFIVLCLLIYFIYKLFISKKLNRTKIVDNNIASEDNSNQ